MSSPKPAPPAAPASVMKLAPTDGSYSPARRHVRKIILLMMVGVRLVCALDRLAWGYLIVEMSAEFGWTNQQQGDIKASFAAGYLLLQIIGGILGDRYGNKMFQVLCLMACVGGLAAAPLAAAIGSEEVGWVYFLMGLASGPQHPTSTAHQKKWCLPTENAWVSAVGVMGSVLGSLFAVLGVASMITLMGWQMTFWTLAAATLLFLVAYVFVVPESPGDCTFMPEDERALYKAAGLLEPTQSTALESRAFFSLSYLKLFGSSAVWACFFAHGTYNFIRYTYEQEMPKYFKDVLQMRPADSSSHLTTLHIVGFIVPFTLKDVLSNAVQTGRCSSLTVRRGSALAGYAVIAAASIGMAAVHKSGMGLSSPWVVTALLDAIWVGVTMQAFSHMANYFDLTEGNTGLLMGVGNTLATIPSFISPKMAAAMMPAWEKVFYTVAGAASVVGLGYSALCSASVVDGTGRQEEKKVK